MSFDDNAQHGRVGAAAADDVGGAVSFAAQGASGGDAVSRPKADKLEVENLAREGAYHGSLVRVRHAGGPCKGTVW